MPFVKHSAKSSGFVSDEPYGSSWDGVVDIAPSKNAVYDAIQGIGYVQGNIAYVDSVGGNDSTGMLGNMLRPYRTIAAAISAIGYLTDSAIVLRAGRHVIGSWDCTFGLKVPNTFYDVVCDRGVTIESYCSYGIWIYDGSVDSGRGNLYGFPIIKNYNGWCTGSVGGVNNCLFNILPKLGLTYFEINQLTNETTSPVACFRSENGNLYVGTVHITLNSRMYSRCTTAAPIFIAAQQSRTYLFGANNAVIDSVAETGMVDAYSLDISNVSQLFISSVRFSTRGQFNGANTDYCVKIQTGIATNDIRFDNCLFEFAWAKPTGKVIDFQLSNAPQTNNVQFTRCKIKSRNSNSYPLNGYSISAQNNISIKIIDTYADSPVTGAGVITNLISSGGGFMVDPNV